ncbi:RIC1 domain-containing protein [Mycena venus]|uniref:RIC1 domain-containing protein n=1 Tax=Mycena venus TaxID=2733690 RepID=A0A8H7CL03_9AGAR|nr:RIC1 domain-containing protein [Mycena venus]
MYFPTTTAHQLSSIPALPNIPPESEKLIALVPSPRKSLFCTLSRTGVSIWRVRPSAVLAYLSRTPTSILDHGENIAVHWAPDGGRIIIQTSQSYLVLITVVYLAETPIYVPPPLPSTSRNYFLPGPGEALPLQCVSLRFEGVIRVDGGLICVSPRKQYILFSTKNPPAVQRIPWPEIEEEHDTIDGEPKTQFGTYETWIFNDHDFDFFVDPDVTATKILYSRATGVETWITSDGRAYFVGLTEESMPADSEGSESPKTPRHHQSPSTDSTSSAKRQKSTWQGTCIHDFEIPRWVQKSRRIDPSDDPDDADTEEESYASPSQSQSSDGESIASKGKGKGKSRAVYNEPRRAVAVAINGKFSLVAVGMANGAVQYTPFPSGIASSATPQSVKIQVPTPYNRAIGPVCTMEWSGDGYVLAVGWRDGWAIFSVGGRCLAKGFGVEDVDINVDGAKFQDTFMFGVRSLFWAPGNFELVVLAHPSPIKLDGQLFVIPFAKSASTGQLAPDNTRYAFLQMDDRALVYRGADQPDMSVINPESDVWQHIKIPQTYLATNWPIRYSSLSSDGRLIAIAGRRGLIHYSSTSGRWKLFADEIQEQAFVVKGGMVWFHHVLIAAVEVSKSYQIRLYSRDMELSNQNVLHREIISCPVVILSLVDNSLLVYTVDNTLFHYLIVPTADTIKLHLCGSITFNGIIAAPSAVRMLSWMIPKLGDPVDDLAVATVLMVVGGQLILLRPRKSGDQEVKYDMQIFADRIEFCWIHLRGINALENSLWAYDGQGIRVWLNALAIEAPRSDENEPQDTVKESVNIPLDFYPLSVLMDKGIIIGAEHEVATRSNLPFVIFRHATSSHLFLTHILLFHLQARQVNEAVVFASHYQNLVFFAHALEILLHTVVESDDDATDDGNGGNPEDGDSISSDTVLRTVVDFLDHFDVALDVVVGCARKTEMTRWKRLFSIVGNPKLLFETCLESHQLKTAASYLLVLHNLEQLDEKHSDVIRLLESAVATKDWQLCRELLRFLRSVDDTGTALRNAVEHINLQDIKGAVSISYQDLLSSPLSLGKSIERAFGSNPECLGIIVVRDLPPVYAAYRERLLKLACAFAKLKEPIREKYADPNSRYSFGWSHGKEIMNGNPDILKGSYYANINPAIENLEVSPALQEAYPEYYNKNIWPKADEAGVEGFEDAFKDLGNFIFRVGCELAVACQPFALSHLNDSSMSLPQLIGTSNTVKARLLHYFPPSSDAAVTEENDPVDNWCGWHKDHSLLTGLCSAMFLREGETVPSPSPASGLYIRSRGGDLTKVSIPVDCLAFQTGEALEVATGGTLRATPHCVRVGVAPGSDKVSRETFALFMQPDVNQHLSDSSTFGQFSKKVFDEHYDGVSA